MMSLSSCIKDELTEPVEVNDVLANVEAQAQAVESSVKHINDLQELIQPYGLDADAMAEKVQTHAKSLSKGISLEEGSLATLKIQGELASLVGAAQAELYRADALDSDAEKLFASLEKSVRTWLGELFVENYSAAVTQAKVEAIAEELSQEIKKQELSVDALASDVEAGLRKDADPKALAALSESLASRSSDLKSFRAGVASIATQINKEYSAAIRTAVSDPTAIKTAEIKTLNEAAQTQQEEVGTVLSNLAAEIAQCKTKLEELQKKLEILEDSIEGLLELVQSVTFLSEYSEDKAIAYYEMGEEKVSAPGKPYDGKCVRTPVKTVELSYMVRPAAAAAAISKEVVSVVGYYAEQIQTRAVDPSNFINFTVTDAVVTDPELGIITVKLAHDLKDDFYYRETGAKCALFIAAGSSDISSKFVELHPKDNSSTVYVEEIKINSDDFEIDEGQSKTLAATVSPSSATNKTVTWSSSNDEVASIDPSTGVLTAVKPGNVKITATTNGIDEWGDPISASVNVRVNAAIRLGGPLYVEVGKTAELSLDFPPAMNVESKVWVTSDKTKATVDNGIVTGVVHTYNQYTYQYNPITITCIVNGNITLTHEMAVVVPQPRQIKLNNYGDDVKSVSMKLDQTISLAGSILPANVDASLFRITYESDGGLGWINFDTGEIKAPGSIGGRYVYIKVKDKDKHTYMKTFVERTVVVNVEPYYVTSIKFDDVEIEPGQTAALSPIFTSDVAGKAPSNTVLSWHSDNESVATVDQNGVVTSLSEGRVTITATSTDGSNVSGKCVVDVVAPWKDFEVGSYVVKTSNGDIDFASDYNTARGKGTVVGVVIAKTNPRTTDKLLPESCTHGIAIALGEGEGNWWNTSPGTSPNRLYEWALQNGYESTMGIDWIGGANVRTGTAGKYVGYNNTQAMKAFISAKGLTSGILSALNGCGVSLPYGASACYLPSVAEMDAIWAASSDLSAKLATAGGVSLKNEAYWTSSDSGNSSSYAALINPLTGEVTGNRQKTNTNKVRYVFAF